VRHPHSIVEEHHRMKAVLKNVVVDPEFRALIPPLRQDELDGLRASIKAEGCRDPLVVWEGKGILLDGHNRYDICKEEKIDCETTFVDLPDREHARLWIYENQKNRRNLDDGQRAAIGLQMTELRSKIAKKERAKKGGETGGRNHPKSSLEADASPELKGGAKERTREAVAREVNVSERQIRKVAQIKKSVAALAGKKAGERVVQDIIDGKTTIPRAKRDAQRADREARKLAELERRAAIAGSSGDGRPRLWEIRHGHCVEVLDAMEPGSARLIFADPNYNARLTYEPGLDDDLPPAEYLAGSRRWIEAAFRVLSPDGAMFLLINHFWSARLRIAAEEAGFCWRQTVTWYEKFGVNTTRMFNLCSRPLVWFTKSPDDFLFHDHAPEVRRKSDRQVKYDDPRADPDGKLLDDVWIIPRLAGTHEGRVAGHPAQLPPDLLLPIIACASDPGDMIVDPFSGTGTTGIACLELGRRYIGIELSEKYVELSRKRLVAREAEVAARLAGARQQPQVDGEAAG
jgi:site-specific DNA-methyltransferase (adenine-specific)